MLNYLSVDTTLEKFRNNSNINKLRQAIQISEKEFEKKRRQIKRDHPELDYFISVNSSKFIQLLQSPNTINDWKYFTKVP
jgi:hypothetical protein